MAKRKTQSTKEVCLKRQEELVTMLHEMAMEERKMEVAKTCGAENERLYKMIGADADTPAAEAEPTELIIREIPARGTRG